MADGTRLELDIGDRTQALAFMPRRYSEEVVDQIVNKLPPSGLFFDVGANAGLITFPVAHQRPDARIVGFEPNPAAVEAWRRNWRLTASPAVALEPVAVSDYEGAANLDCASFDLGAGAIVASGVGVDVDAVTLDAYCAARGVERIDVMKVDVQGHEPEVLRGARSLLRSGAIRWLIVEFEAPILESRGLSRLDMLKMLAAYGMTPASAPDAEDVAFAPAR